MRGKVVLGGEFDSSNEYANAFWMAKKPSAKKKGKPPNTSMKSPCLDRGPPDDSQGSYRKFVTQFEMKNVPPFRSSLGNRMA